MITVCIKCGRFGHGTEWGWDYINLNCPKCKKARIMLLVKRKYAYLKAEGVKFKSYKRRAKKAYYTRMANMYTKDYERFKRLTKGLSKAVKGQITRRINCRSHNVSK